MYTINLLQPHTCTHGSTINFFAPINDSTGPGECSTECVSSVTTVATSGANSSGDVRITVTDHPISWYYEVLANYYKHNYTINYATINCNNIHSHTRGVKLHSPLDWQTLVVVDCVSISLYPVLHVCVATVPSSLGALGGVYITIPLG